MILGKEQNIFHWLSHMLGQTSKSRQLMFKWLSSVQLCICRQILGALPYLDGQLIELLSTQSSLLNSLWLPLYLGRL